MKGLGACVSYVHCPFYIPKSDDTMSQCVHEDYFVKREPSYRKKNVWLHPAPQGSTQVQDCCPCLTVVEASILRRFAPLSSELPRNYKGTPCKECRSWKWWLMDVDGVMFFESRGVYVLFFWGVGGIWRSAAGPGPRGTQHEEPETGPVHSPSKLQSLGSLWMTSSKCSNWSSVEILNQNLHSNVYIHIH